VEERKDDHDHNNTSPASTKDFEFLTVLG